MFGRETGEDRLSSSRRRLDWDGQTRIQAMQLLNRSFLTLLVTAGIATSASAQAMRGTFGIGAGISMVRPVAPELKTEPAFSPTLRRVPSKGWGFAVAFHWFEARVDARLVGGEGPLGRIAVRPLMFGVGYTAVRDRISVSPSFVAGPALNTLVITDEASDRFQLGGSSFQKTIGTVSIAVRPGVTVTYALYPRLGLTASGGYIWNRPRLVLRTPEGDVSQRGRTNGLLLSGGIVVTIF
jgi:hypothetical protein